MLTIPLTVTFCNICFYDTWLHFFFMVSWICSWLVFLSTQPEEGSCARKCLKAAKSLIGAYIQAAVSLKLGWAPENLPNVALRIPWKQLPAHLPLGVRVVCFLQLTSSFKQNRVKSSSHRSLLAFAELKEGPGLNSCSRFLTCKLMADRVQPLNPADCRVHRVIIPAPIFPEECFQKKKKKAFTKCTPFLCLLTGKEHSE